MDANLRLDYGPVSGWWTNLHTIPHPIFAKSLKADRLPQENDDAANGSAALRGACAKSVRPVPSLTGTWSPDDRLNELF